MFENLNIFQVLEHKYDTFIVFETREASWVQNLTSRTTKKHDVLSPGGFLEHSGAWQGLHGLARCVQNVFGDGFDVALGARKLVLCSNFNKSTTLSFQRHSHTELLLLQVWALYSVLGWATPGA